MPFSPRNSAIGFLFACTALAACGSSGTTTFSPATSSEEFKYGEGLSVDQTAESSVESGGASDAANGTLLLTLQDQNDNGAEGIPVQVRGLVETLLVSDKDGRVRLEGPPGQYRIEVIAGCTDRLLIEAGGRGYSSLVAGSTATGKLAVRWMSRIVPAIGAYPSKYPDWYIGDTIDVYYDVLDRCRDDKAPGGSFPTWAFRTSGNLEIVGSPRLVADEKAQGLINVRCTRVGEASLVAFDSKNQPDEFDLIRYMVVMAGSKMRCANAPQ